MKIHVSRIPDEGLHVDGEEMLETGNGEPILVRHVLDVEKVEEDVLIRGELETILRLQCGRCLAEFEKEIDIPVSLTLFPAGDEVTAENRQLSEEEVGSGVYTEDEIDMEIFMRELVELHKPMRALCSDDCKGICPECGANLSEKECGCAVRHVDPRFQALERLLKKKN